MYGMKKEQGIVKEAVRNKIKAHVEVCLIRNPCYLSQHSSLQFIHMGRGIFQVLELVFIGFLSKSE